MDSLLSAAASGSDDALGRLLEAFRPYLQLLAERELPSDLRVKAGASDLVQETCMQACRDFPAFRGRSPAEFKAWLKAILGHQALKWAERYRDAAKRDVGREVALDAGAGTERPGWESVPGRGETPSREALQAEEAARLHAALGRLPGPMQAVIRLRHEEGREFAAIAAAMGKTEAAVRKLWSRAVAAWQREVGGEPAHG